MTDPITNPYATATTLPADSGRLRPIGTVILAVLLLLFSVPMLGAVAFQFVRSVEAIGTIPPIVMMIKHAVLGVVAISSIVAAAGLLSGRSSGWWCTIAFCYVWFSAFALVPTIHHPTQADYSRVAGHALFCFICWLYMNRENVRCYYRVRTSGVGRVHAGLFALIFIVIFGMVAC